MENIIGSYKQFIIIERDSLDELKKMAMELLREGEYDVSNYHKGMAMIECIEFIKKNNIYNGGKLKIKN